MTDASNVAILPARDLFADVQILAPDRESFDRISDKHALTETARELGIAVPLCLDLDSADDLLDSTVANVVFPTVIKAARSVTGGQGERIRTGVSYASTAQDLRKVLANWPPGAYPVLIQEKIEGPGIGIFLLRWEGRTLAAAAHRRIREKPPTGGVSVYREAIEPDPDLVDRCERLLDAFDWRGVAMVEFKKCNDTGVPYLMEVNGRLWGSLQLAIDAGIDFPALLVETTLGEPRTPSDPYRSGVRCRWFWGDVDHTLTLLRRTPRPSLVGCLRAVARLFRPSTPGDRLEVLRASDPRPFLRETSEWFRTVWASVRTRSKAQSLRQELYP
jgi:predicted ATP-grasp superfamily ATP-dependent carboligase